MKLSTALILAASAGAASAASRKAIDVSASHKVSGAAARKLIRASRRLEDEEQDNQDEEEDEFSYLMNYSMKFVQCVPDYQVYGEDGEPESSSVIYRLCPNDAESESAFGCTDEEAFGDYVVGINSYTNAIAEAMQQEAEQNGGNYNAQYYNGEEFELQEYAECREAEMEQNENDNQNDEGRRLEGNQQGYFIGPKCIDVVNAKGKVIATDIALELFTDEMCSTPSSTSWYELTGMTIPYSTGMDMYQKAVTCGGYNENGEYEIAEICQRLLEEPSYRCDATYSGGCEEIESLEADLKASESKMSGGMIFLIVIIVLAVLGLGIWFFMKQKSKKEALLGGGGGTSA
mmetsp:Transcript_20254/g.43699  ORF Transcript_20254/g.43699 Transcript_20254/m.43699 type:complete len:346 (+) Transcript_20254:101-1138(+)